MSTKTTKRSVKKALCILKNLQTQLTTKNKKATMENVLEAIQKEENALDKKRERVTKKQEKVQDMVELLKVNKKTKKTTKDHPVPDMYPVFRKIYDMDNRPAVTICTVTKGTREYQGWAICSDIENPRHKKGDNIALKRVAEVLVTKKNTLPINRNEAIDILDTLNTHPSEGFKSQWAWL